MKKLLIIILGFLIVISGYFIWNSFKKSSPENCGFAGERCLKYNESLGKWEEVK